MKKMRLGQKLYERHNKKRPRYANCVTLGKSTTPPKSPPPPPPKATKNFFKKTSLPQKPAKMAKNRQKWSKIGKNGQKWAKTAKNGPKTPKMEVGTAKPEKNALSENPRSAITNRWVIRAIHRHFFGQKVAQKVVTHFRGGFRRVNAVFAVPTSIFLVFSGPQNWP